MNITSIQRLLEEYEDKEFNGSVSIEMIDAAQKNLSVWFPSDYIEFLSAFGSGAVSSEEFIGLGGKPHLDVVFVTNRLREKSEFAKFQETLVPIRHDGFGNYDCIDLSQSNKTVSTIVMWVHDASDEDEQEVIANGYWTWFNDMLQMIDEIDEE